MGIQLVVDSASDLPKEFINKNNIKVVPLYVLFGKEEYRDGIDISNDVFYERLENGDYSTTSQVTPEAFEEAFREALSKGDDVLCITIGSNASGTCQSATIAKTALDTERIKIIDSNMLCMGTGYLIIKAMEMIQEGLDIDEIVEELEKLTQNQIEHLFCVDTLEYLKKGGRIRASKAIIAEILNIKPILNVKDAITQPIGKVRGHNKIINYFLTHIENTMDFEKNNFICVAHSHDKGFADELVKAFNKKFDWEKPIYISEIGPVIGSHTGPGVLAVFYIKKD